MKFPLTCTALSTSLLLAACSSSTPEDNRPPTPVSCPALGTQVLTPLNITSPAVTPTLNWNAPRATGKLLITSTGKLAAQNLKPLQGLNVQNITPDLRQVRTPAGKTDQAFAHELEQAGLQVQPDFLYQPLSTANDPGFPGNTGIKVNNVVMTQTYLTRIHVPEAWDVLSKCNLPLDGALTAVLDSAVDTTHPELQGRSPLTSRRSAPSGAASRTCTTTAPLPPGSLARPETTGRASRGSGSSSGCFWRKSSRPRARPPAT